MNNNYVFTFENDDELFEAERSGYIESYDIVRICRETSNGSSIDYPCKSREQFNWHLNEYKDSIVKIYPSKHFYDVMDYL
jgi:hypothetical protein